MYAIVDSGSITETFSNPRRITVNDTTYSTQIYSLWSEAELNAIGIYTVVQDGTNFKDSTYYTNTDITYTFAGGVVTATFGTATARTLDDINENWTQQEIDDAVPGSSGRSAGDPKDTVVGLKSIFKETINNQCANTLRPSDWMYIKAGEEDVSMDSGWKTWRASVRTKCNSMQAQIDGAANVDALAALYHYTGDPATRPLGEFPTKA